MDTFTSSLYKENKKKCTCEIVMKKKKSYFIVRDIFIQKQIHHL